MTIMKKLFPYILGGLCLLLAGCQEQGQNKIGKDREYTNSIGMEFVRIQAGSFDRGIDQASEYDSLPIYWVTLTQDFYLGRHEVTQTQWEAVMGKNPSRFKAPDNPVENVSWHDVQEFIRRLNELEGHRRYRLPTEAEWEYTARAGSPDSYCFGDDSRELVHYAWFVSNSGETTHPVGQKTANAWGLYDVHGNVAEWVQDRYAMKTIAYGSMGGSMVDPRGPGPDSCQDVLRGGESKNKADKDDACPAAVLRGGSWKKYPGECSVSTRNATRTDIRMDHVGFRLAMALEDLPPEPEAMPKAEPKSKPAAPQQAANPQETQGAAVWNSIGMEFVPIPAGTVHIGPERHAHAINQPFYLGKYEVTQKQWQEIMGENPSHFPGSENPVENVSWDEAQKFIRRLNQREGHQRYRLPTEAEWEYAARAGSTSPSKPDQKTEELERFAWCGENAIGMTHPVGQKEPNPCGLHDMYGNVSEWAQDWAGVLYIPFGRLSAQSQLNPELRSLRGGSWRSVDRCRPNGRSELPSEYRGNDTGLRLFLSIE